MATVLIVDDEGSIVELLTDMVNEVGHTALTATNGLEALKMAQVHQPTLIISDITMPEMSGYALVKALRVDPALAQITVLLISAGTRPHELPPKTAFLLKPLNMMLLKGFLLRL